MPKDQVLSALGQPYQQLEMRRDGSTTIETVEYVRLYAVPGNDEILERYSVRFVDEKLESYKSTGNVGSQDAQERQLSFCPKPT
jgi:hypothetical protein